MLGRNNLIAFYQSILNADDTFGVTGDVLFVRNDDDGVALLAKLVEEPHDVLAGFGIQIAGGFVCKDDRGSCHECASDSDALALTAGKFVRFVAGAVGESDVIERLHCALTALIFADARIDERQFDIVKRIAAWKKIEGLEDEADFFITDFGEIVVVEPGNVDTIKEVIAACWRVEAADDIHQGRFARAGRPHDRDVFVLLHADHNAAQSIDELLPHLVNLLDVLQKDDGVLGGVLPI